MNETPELDQRVQLHEEITVFYSVVCYRACFYTGDGSRVIAEAEGDTIGGAIANLEIAAARLPKTLAEIRSLPGISGEIIP